MPSINFDIQNVWNAGRFGHFVYMCVICEMSDLKPNFSKATLDFALSNAVKMVEMRKIRKGFYGIITTRIRKSFKVLSVFFLFSIRSLLRLENINNNLPAYLFFSDYLLFCCLLFLRCPIFSTWNWIKQWTVFFHSTLTVKTLTKMRIEMLIRFI